LRRKRIQNGSLRGRWNSPGVPASGFGFWPWKPSPSLGPALIEPVSTSRDSNPGGGSVGNDDGPSAADEGCGPRSSGNARPSSRTRRGPRRRRFGDGAETSEFDS
jgi:hypothetical protein